MNSSLQQVKTAHVYFLLLVVILCLSSVFAALRTPAFASPRRSLAMSAILDSPSAQRNKEPIWNVLNEKVLPLLSGDSPIRVLEIAAGCGVHTEHFAIRLSERGTSFQYFPTDLDATSRASIQGRLEQSKLSNYVESPLSLTLNANGIVEPETTLALDENDLDLILCINMIHISPFDATRGLMKIAGTKLRQGGVLFAYGPYKVAGTAVESNL